MPTGTSVARITTKDYAPRADTVPAGASFSRITTQNSPGARDTNLTAGTGCFELYTGQAGSKTSREPAGLTQHVHQYVTRKVTREGTRKLQFVEGTRKLQFAELPPTSSMTHSAVASPHKIAQGKRRKLMDPAPWMRFHPFVATLERWASGVSATCGEPWTEAAITTAVERGPHTSALTPDARQLIEEEVQYQTSAGFSEVVLWSNLRNKLPVNLKISPLAVIPQVGRRGRLLLDLSFPVQAARPTSKRGRRHWVPPPPLAPSINSTTTKLSPDYPIKEIGRVLPRLLVFMVAVPAEETIMFAKIDLSDGFWRMLVQDTDKWNFAYVLPGTTSQPTRLVIPHALQMGWTESPGYFCAATETGRDVMQALVDEAVQLPPHQFDSFMVPAAPACRQTSPLPPPGPGRCQPYTSTTIY